MNKKQIEINKLEQLRELYNNDIGQYINLNDDIQNSPIEGFNIDDNGISLIDETLWENNKERFWKIEKEEVLDNICVDDKIETNKKLGVKLFYWIDISFLNEWRNEWDYETKELTTKSLKELKKLINERIATIKEGK